ncbi:hypothetical protein K438DRAFT_1960726 [Mycena galopus ATCC 62051]|nr:hypothetical protein K438DRAFT_1960726 [Mycena galopus ATCC 62051]
MYLVTQGRKVGIWYNWTVVKTMITGFKNGAYHGHNSVEGCIREWQLHCALGVHPHPVDPQLASTTPSLRGSASPNKIPTLLLKMTPARLSCVVDGPLQAELKKFCVPNLPRDVDEASTTTSSSILTCSSVTASDWSEVPPRSRYFALWQGKIVYADRQKVKRDFLSAEGTGKKPCVISTDLYNEAQAFSEGIYWVAD